MNNEKEEFVKRFFFEESVKVYDKNKDNNNTNYYYYHDEPYKNHFNSKTQSNNIIINILNYFYDLIN
jgi:hypothetical protein